VTGAMRSVTTKKEDRKQGRGEGTDVCKETEKRFVRRLQRTRETRQKKKGPVEKKKSCITTFLSFFFKKNKKKSPGLVNFQAGWRGARTVFKSSIPSTVAQEKRRLWRTLQQLAKKNKKICATLGACTFKMAQELGIFQKSFPFMDHSLSSCFPLATMPGAPFRVWPSSRPERAPV